MNNMVLDCKCALIADKALAKLKKRMVRVVAKLFDDNISDDVRDRVTYAAMDIEAKLVQKLGFDEAEFFIDELFNERLYI